MVIYTINTFAVAIKYTPRLLDFTPPGLEGLTFTELDLPLRRGRRIGHRNHRVSIAFISTR